MADTDWRKILSFSQKELFQADKQELCESLSWMEADDIELNFSDLKTLFKLAQDILKYKSEQVKNLRGELDTIQKKHSKKKSRKDLLVTKSDNTLETLSHQEEIIKANKDILEQLYAEIAELEERKSKYSDTLPDVDKETDSSPDIMTQMDTKAQLENEIYKKNKHIKKLLGYVKVLEDENSKFKEKISILKEKLQEATNIIEDLTDQMLNMSDECNRLKESLGSSEQVKSSLLDEISALRQEILLKKDDDENVQEDVKAKIHQLKSLVRSQRTEIEVLTTENRKIKGNQVESQTSDVLVETSSRLEDELKIKELGENLVQASNEIMKSADLINILKKENKHLRSLLEEFNEAFEFDLKNESDDGKEQTIINKLKKKNQKLTSVIQHIEEMMVLREKEVLELSSELNLLQSDEGIKKLSKDLKDKEKHIKIKDEKIKSMIKDINKLNVIVNDLQMENETMRQKLNLSLDDKVPTEGILLEFHNLKQRNLILNKEFRAMENKLVDLELENRQQKSNITKYTKLLDKNELIHGTKNNRLQEREKHDANSMQYSEIDSLSKQVKYTGQEFNALVEENEGLRKGLQEILNILKENDNNNPSGILALECPSLEAVLHALEARHAAGWFAPHMATTLELKAALGGKDALLAALHESRKEIFDLMSALSKESQKSTELRDKLVEVEKQISEETKTRIQDENIHFGEFNSWLSDNEDDNIDFLNKTEIEKLILKRNTVYDKEVKNALTYFRNKFEMLFHKMSEIAITSADEKNKWLIQEELYKAQIENLSVLNFSGDNENASDVSPGLITCRDCHILERKCTYLGELYKNVKSSYEDINNKILEYEKHKLTSDAKFESKIQNLIIIIVSLAEKIRYLLPEQMFFKQNKILNETVIKYRQLLEADVRKVESSDLLSRLEDFVLNAMETIKKQLKIVNSNDATDEEKNILSSVKRIIEEKEMQEMCSELKSKNQQIDELIKINLALQENEAKLIDNTIATETKEEIKTMKSQINKINKENGVLKEQYKEVQYQLHIVKSQVNDIEQTRLSYETELNILRHQILDLQSGGDNKAIITRLSNEILVAHLQSTEAQKTIGNLKQSLFREKDRRIEAEEALTALHKVLDMLTVKYERKFRYMDEVMQVLRFQYQGSLPLTSLENYVNNLEELSKTQNDINEKLNEIEVLRYGLMTKHSVYDQVLELTNANCSQDLENCPHKLQLIVSLGTKTRELENYNSKTQSLEKANEKLLQRCLFLERTLVMCNQGLKNSVKITKEIFNNENMNVDPIIVEDIKSDSESEDRDDETFTLLKPCTTQLKNQINIETFAKKTVATLTEFPWKIQNSENKELVHVGIQNNLNKTDINNKLIQTDVDSRYYELNHRIEFLELANKQKEEKLSEHFSTTDKQRKDILQLNEKNKALLLKNESLADTNSKLIILKEQLNNSIELLKIEYNNFKSTHRVQLEKLKNESKQEMQSLLLSIQQIENEKNNIVLEYRELLEKEREDNSKIIKELQSKVLTLQTDKDRKASASSNYEAEVIKESISKYSAKNTELENICFKLQHDLENYKTEIVNSQSELQRWKNLATERLEKMEQLSLQLKERHNNEVESYKAENKHWLVQLNETQREHMELRARLTEEKALHVKQLSEKDAQIEQLRSVVHNLKTQIINMQTMLSVHDPSFDLSAIVEVEEASDGSQQGFDKLELNFESSVDLHEIHDDFARVATSTTIWQEPIIERLRREKQLLSKQNGVLRRQIKAIAARERRARLDAQNLKNQVFRISTSGSKAASAESAALHNKIASLQAQLTSARRDAHSSVALWDKWKRAHQASERWQARYDEKCHEITKLEASLNLAKSAVSRLEKEKRVLLSRLTEARNDKQLMTEKQEDEASEKPAVPIQEYDYSEMQTVPVSMRALLERIEAQQRRIVALEVAEKGNEPLVSEYEKALAQITSLKGQVLKLESTLLESQIRSPLKNTQESQPELEYWKSYCNMLKEENTQLTLRVNSLESTPTTVHQHRINDLEQTVLTLRGLVSKLQAEQKSSGSGQKRVDSRPNSGRSASEKVRNQLESYKTEISNLKKSIQEKDALLERSKDMLRIAAEREDELLTEISFLRRQLEEVTDYKKRTNSV